MHTGRLAMRGPRPSTWQWVDPRSPDSSPVVARDALFLLAVVGLVAALVITMYLTSDWDGTAYEVVNQCDELISVDNGHDGLRIEAGESASLAGFGDLVLQISRPGDTMSDPVTFRISPAVVVGDFCPS